MESILFEDDYIGGIIPVLFAEDAAAASVALLANPSLARKDVQKLQKLFFAPESIIPDEAVQVVNKPRLGEGSYDLNAENLALPVSSVETQCPAEVDTAGQPARKRARIEQPISGTN